MAQRAPSKQSAPADVISNMSLGYNGYTDPTLTSPQMWAQAANCFSGPFGYIQRSRFANIITSANLSSGTPFTSLKYYALPGVGAYVLGDLNGQLYAFDTGNNYAIVQRINNYVGEVVGVPTPALTGPWSREVVQNIVYEMNGQIKQAGRTAFAQVIEGFGLDAPDVSPQVVITGGVSVNITGITRSSGTVTVTVGSTAALGSIGNVLLCNITGVTDTSFNGSFSITIASSTTLAYTQLGQNTSSSAGTVNTNISKAVGRSYSYAWENANKSHIGAPSPATQYIVYSNQNGQLQLIEAGTVTVTSGSAIVAGVGTFFTSAWVGRNLWVQNYGNAGRIVSVQSPTQMTLASNATSSPGAQSFQVFDPQATHIRIYATADGGATYFRIARNAFVSSALLIGGAGLQYFDLANAEPPSSPFTTETAQANNLPPPVGAFLNEYQGRLCVYGVPGALQTLFYSNSESTSQGLLQESFAPLNQITFPVANGQLNGMIEFPGSAIIWSDKQDMFRLTGLLTDNTVTGIAQATASAQQGATISRLPYNLGCATPFAAEITPLGGIWLTSNAEVWLFTDKYAPRNIGRPVQDILNSIIPANLKLARMKYYHTNTRNWLALSVAANSSTFNNTVLVLDLDLLASNGQPSYFTFDMATNHPSWYVFTPGPLGAGGIASRADSLEVVYEAAGVVRLLSSGIDLIQDIDYTQGFGTEMLVPGASITTHAWGNDSAPMLKRPSWVRFNTNRSPAVLSSETILTLVSVSRLLNSVTVTTNGVHGLSVGSVVFLSGITDPTYNGTFVVTSVPSTTTFTFTQAGVNSSSSGGTMTFGWNFQIQAIDDDYYTFTQPLTLTMTPGMNDSSALGGNPDFSTGLAFRHSPELFKVGGVNFVMGRRLKFQTTFPSGTGTSYQLRSIQLGFGPTPPR